MTNEFGSLAFCYLTISSHNQDSLWCRFFEQAAPDSYNIYCHNKESFKDSDEFLSKYEIDDKIFTEWGKISLVRASLLLFKEALKNPNNKFFLLLSESCIPLWSLETIKSSIFQYDTNLLLPQNSWTATSDSAWNKAHRWDKIKHYIKNPSDFKKASQWVCLNRSTVEFLINNEDLDNFSAIHAADEHYFPTMIHLHSLGFSPRSVTFADWYHQTAFTDYNLNSHPYEYKTLSPNDINIARGSYFLRKVSPFCDISEELQDFILQ